MTAHGDNSQAKQKTALATAASSATKALEAIAAGDIGYATQVLESLIRDTEDALYPRPQLRCGNCGATFAWPGDLDTHMRFQHWAENWRKAGRA